MEKNVSGKVVTIQAGMTILDVVSKYRSTEAVFKKYDEKAGVCLCCQALFEPLEKVAVQYHLDLEELLEALQTSVSEGNEA